MGISSRISYKRSLKEILYACAAYVRVVASSQ